MNSLRLLVVATGISIGATGVVAQESLEAEPLLTETILPTAIAIRPSNDKERHELFVADDKSGTVYRVASDALDQPQEFITGFGEGEAPSSLLFMNGRTLIAALAEEPIRLQAYEIPDERKSITADQTKFTVRASADRGSIAALAIHSLALFAVGSDDREGWLIRSRIRSSVPGDLKPFLKVGTRPTCVAISTRGWIVVGDAGQRDGGVDSRLTFHHPNDPASESPLLIEPKLHDVTAITYSPQGSLFAADSAETDPVRGGIFRIDMDYHDNTIDGKAVRVVEVENPTAISFAPDGTLYLIARDRKLFRVIGIERSSE